MNERASRVLTGVFLAGGLITAPTAAWATLTGSVVLRDFHITFKDLDPNDGITAGYSITPGETFIDAEVAGDEHFHEVFNSWWLPLTSDSAVAGNVAHAEIAPATLSATVVAPSNQLFTMAYAGTAGSIHLEPNTEAHVIADYQMSLTSDGTALPNLAYVTASIGNPIFGRPYWGQDIYQSTGSRSGTIDIVLSSDLTAPDPSLQFPMGLYIEARLEPIAAPIPEPGTTALLAVGLLGLAGVRRLQAP